MPKWIFNPFTSNFDAIEEGEHFFPATCTAAEDVNDLVYVSAAGPTVSKIDIDDDVNKMPPIGIIIEKLSVTSCTVQTSGEVALAGLALGKAYFAGTDSKPTATRPPAPGTGKRAVQGVGVAMDTDILLLRIAGNFARIIPT